MAPDGHRFTLITPLFINLSTKPNSGRFLPDSLGEELFDHLIDYVSYLSLNVRTKVNIAAINQFANATPRLNPINSSPVYIASKSI